LLSLPDGCFIRIEGSSYLVWGDSLLLWSPAAYRQRLYRPKYQNGHCPDARTDSRCLLHGYTPVVHSSSLTL
jgi:hypothetical protein